MQLTDETVRNTMSAVVDEPSRPRKVLVLGDVRGRFMSLLKKVHALHKRDGVFDALFCVGSFFGDAIPSFDVFKGENQRMSSPLAAISE